MAIRNPIAQLVNVMEFFLRDIHEIKINSDDVLVSSNEVAAALTDPPANLRALCTEWNQDVDRKLQPN